MASRWSKKEDFIVCEFCLQNPWAYSRDVDVEAVMELLEKAGCTPRNRSAVKKRARDYELLREGVVSPYIPEQAKEIFDLVDNSPSKEETDSWIGRYVRERYCADDEESLFDEAALFSAPPNDKTHLLAIDAPKIEKTFYSVFDELLDAYYAKHKTDKKTLGAVKKEFKYDLVCTYGVNEDTFNSIRREKYKTVSRKLLFKLCFALELEYEDAKRLLASVGYDFRRNVKEEVVIEAILQSKSHRRFIISEIDETLEKYANVRLFS